MQNIEFKARCPHLDAVRKTLRQAGVAPERLMRQVDTYFSVARGRLKLREIDTQQAELIFYQRADQAEARLSDYVRVEVGNPTATLEALTRALGVRCVVKKTRELYLWEHTRVHLDTVEGLGTFLELETIVTDQSLEQARAECERIRIVLGIQAESLVDRSYADMVQGRPPEPRTADTGASRG